MISLIEISHCFHDPVDLVLSWGLGEEEVCNWDIVFYVFFSCGIERNQKTYEQ